MNKILITCHGYTGYPEEMEPFGQYFEEKGYIWFNLQLPGHGTTPEELRGVTWKDWATYIDQQVQEQLNKSSDVIFAGLSLGGAVTLYALEEFPQIKAGVALAPPYQILTGWHRFLAKLPLINFWIEKTEDDARDMVDPVDEDHRSYMRHHTSSVRQLDRFVTHVRERLGEITQPLMLIHGIKDRVIPVESADQILSRVNSEIPEKLLVNAGHVITREKQRVKWFEQAYHFVEGILGE